MKPNFVAIQYFTNNIYIFSIKTHSMLLKRLTILISSNSNNNSIFFMINKQFKLHVKF